MFFVCIPGPIMPPDLVLWLNSQWLISQTSQMCLKPLKLDYTKNKVSFPILLWAAEWDFQQFDILTSVDSDEPLQTLFKLRTSKWCSVSSLTIIEYSSDWSEALLVAHTTLLEISCTGSYSIVWFPTIKKDFCVTFLFHRVNLNVFLTNLQKKDLSHHNPPRVSVPSQWDDPWLTRNVHSIPSNQRTLSEEIKQKYKYE